MGLLPPPTVAHHPKGSPDGQSEVLEKKASCCQGCLFFHFFTQQAVSPYWVQGPSLSRGYPRAQADPFEATSKNDGRDAISLWPWTSSGRTLPPGNTGQRPRTSVVDMTGGAPGIDWVGTRDAAQASMMPRKAVNGSTAEERLGRESQLVPQLGSVL